MAMTQDEAADLILLGLYERRDVASPIPDILEVARVKGVTDEGMARRAATYLQYSGLLRNFGHNLDGQYSGAINHLGVRLVEQAGAGSPMAHFHRPPPSQATVTVHGNVDRSNLAVQSSAVRQSSSSEPSGLLEGLSGFLKKIWTFLGRKP